MLIWTRERESRLAELWAKGYSCSKIAADLQCFSHCGDGGRSAVIGKIHRLKLPRPFGKKVPNDYKRSPVPRVKPMRPSRLMAELSGHFATQPEPRIKHRIAPIAPVIATAANNGLGVTMFELTESTCRWPLSGEHLTLLYCGAKPLAPLPYCACHAGIAYAAASPRKRSPPTPAYRS